MSGMDDTLAEIEKTQKECDYGEECFINGRNIWSTWGAELMDGALEAILTPPPVKDYIENDSRLEHGIQITSSPEICKMDSRELTLPFLLRETRKVTIWINIRPLYPNW